jgi:translation elongation factor P/translation initiation factor 5A
MASTTDVRKGVVIRQPNDLYVVVEFQHVNPGKGAAFVRTRMKSLGSGKVVEVTYKTSESVDIVQVDFRTMQFLYKSGDNFAFMNMESYEQIEMNGDLVGDEAKYLKEGLDVVVGLYGGLTEALLVAGLYVVVQQFESNLIYPVVVKKVVGVPPLLVILALLIGFKLFGFLGVLLSVPIAAAVQELVADIDKRKRAALPPELAPQES